ncbi:ABC-type taurine transport system ATPase subunit [Mycobacteroides chelonae]|nr:ABC-type taurine transport system ATPase subunit [Mycobacteroides chelonae]
MAYRERQRRARAQVRKGAPRTLGAAPRPTAHPSRVGGQRESPHLGDQRWPAAASGDRRALAAETPLFLLDEPFAALDALTRECLQEDVRQVSAESGRVTVFVTHSADEAAFLGSRIVVLTRRPGQVALDTPVGLPRTGVDPDDLCRSPDYAELRTEVGRAVKAAAA